MTIYIWTILKTNTFYEWITRNLLNSITTSYVSLLFKNLHICAQNGMYKTSSKSITNCLIQLFWKQRLFVYMCVTRQTLHIISCEYILFINKSSHFWTGLANYKCYEPSVFFYPCECAVYYSICLNANTDIYWTFLNIYFRFWDVAF